MQTQQSMSRPTTAPEVSKSPSFSPGATAGGHPSGQSQQVQRDLQQLQLHNERQAAAAAAEAASTSVVPGSGPSTSPTQNLNTNAPITQILGVMSSNGGSNNTGAPSVQGIHLPSPLFNSTQVSGTMNVPPSAGMQVLPLMFPGSNTGGNGSNGSGGPYSIGSPVVGSEQAGSSAGTFGAPGSSEDPASVQKESGDHEVGTPQIFKATYSGVPVFEMICRGVAVMRRRSDSYLNATQILKVAKFDKPQRTRILEREVQKGEHEKVQGGYGKYQGTWVPYDRGVQLCQEYNVLHLLQPLLEYQFSKINSPPLAPKHITAASNKPRKPREPKVPGTPKMKKSKLKGSTQLLPKPGMQGPIMGIIDASVSGREGSMHVYGDGDEDISTSEQDDDETHSRAGMSLLHFLCEYSCYMDRSHKSSVTDDGYVNGVGSEASMDETMSILSAQSRTPSPLESRPDFSSSEISDSEVLSPSRRRQRSMERSPRSRKKQNNRPGDELFVGYHGGQGRQSSSQQQLGYYSPRIHHSQDVEMRPRDGSHSRQSSPSHRRRGHPRASDTGAWQSDRASNAGMAPSESNQSHYADILLNYFVSDSSSPPSILINPPPDLDFDLIIDEEGHTPLHWAVAMARTKIVKLLVQHGADIYRVNNQGQTALMRSVLFTNNFDMKTFPSLLEILQKTIFTIDKNDQTVFHHVAVTAGMRGKVHASRYYMECLLDKLAQHPQELSSIINVQDAVGDTALIIAARIANKKVVRLLLDAGADPKIRNKSGRNADEFLQDPDFYAGGSSSSSLPPPPLPPLQHQHSSLPASSSPSTSALGAQNYPQQYPAHSHHQQQHYSSSPTLQRMSHTAGQQPHPGALPPSASSSGSRVHGHPSPIPPGHPSSNMRSVTPPPSRQEGYPSSSSSMDRPSTLGYQDYPPNAPQRNSFQSQPLPPPSPSSASHYIRNLDPNSRLGRLNDLLSGSGFPGHQGSPRLGHVSDRGVPMEIRPLSRDPSVAPGSTPGPQGVGNGINIDNNNGRASQRMIPAVTDLLEQLTQSYEKELYEKEQDLLDARNVLHGIQTEIQEGHQSIEELRAKTMYLGQAEDQIRTLEGMIRQEINLRQRLKLENLVQQEEARLRREMEQEKAREQEKLAGGGVPGGVDMGRVKALEKEAAELRSSLTHLQQTRKDQVEQIVQLKSQQGKRRQEYKRLVALCCNISIEDVDALLVPLLNTLGSEDNVL
ncbi:hypothetical protein BGZ58_001896 [Dissophora ornata]|nr:hypothetical protein BGZ58_001896 [Dissophora ornata]